MSVSEDPQWPTLVPDTLWELIEFLLAAFRAQATRWPAMRSRPKVPIGRYFCTPKRHSLAHDAETVALRFRHDLLATPA